MSTWPWPITGRILDTGPLPEPYPGFYPDKLKAEWQPWIDAARAGATVEELRDLEPDTDL